MFNDQLQVWNLNRTVAGKKTQTADIDPIMNYRLIMSF